MRIKSIFLLLFISLGSQAQHKWAQTVNPFIGTDGTGHTFPGATSPFGMVQLSPDTRLDGWEGTAGYYYKDKFIYGFSHTHLSGTGIADYCDILFMPGTGKLSWNNGDKEKRGYKSAFDHSSEKAFAGYYSVQLSDPKVKAELTTTTRTGYHRYTWENPKKKWLIIDLVHRDEVIESFIEPIGSNAVRGYRRSKSWANNQVVYFYAEFNQSFKIVTQNGESIVQGKGGLGKSIKSILTFEDQKNAQIVSRVGISMTSLEGAQKNLIAEQQGFDFDNVVANATAAWEKELSKIEIESTNLSQRSVFYTALYHTFIAPNILSDVDGSYLGMDAKIHIEPNHHQYTVFSLWDTFRALHPLFTIVQQKRTTDFINTMLRQYQQSGRLPVWELAANETNCMIGYHAVSVISDAYSKNIGGFDKTLAIEAMMSASKSSKFGIKEYIKNGFIPANEDDQSVSKTLEYAYNDWCIAEMAKGMNMMLDFDEFDKRSNSWVNLFDFSTGFFRPKINNAFVTDFNPLEVTHSFTEANAFQYSLFVPHDIPTFEKYLQLGPKLKLEEAIDRVFETKTPFFGKETPDISGLIGQYAHGNEPSQHNAWMYNRVGNVEKCIKYVHQIIDSFYTDKPDGLIGNDDCGQMSAWYVMSALGFYQINPGAPIYDLAYPKFNRSKIHLENGNTFTIWADSKSNIFQPTFKNGNDEHLLPFKTLHHQQILDGGTVDFRLSKESYLPVKSFGAIKNAWPLPAWEAVNTTFKNAITLKPQRSLLHKGCYYYYQINNGPYKTLNDSLILDTTCAVSMHYVTPLGDRSETVTSIFYKLRSDINIKYKYPAHKSFAADGDFSLFDGLRGTQNWRKGNWQGFYGTDFDAVVDFENQRVIKSVTVNYLQEEGSWIFSPLSIEIYTSTDGINFNTPIIVKTEHLLNHRDDEIKEVAIPINQNCKSIRIRAVSPIKCRKGHPGAGKDAFIFIDEIEID